ncbi:MAG: Uma2 family endonuclease [Candidatus Bipolaricaulia bacterium]
MSVKVRKRRFTVEEYYKLAQAGVLSEDDRVELIEGEIIEMVPIGSRHAACVKRLNHQLSQKIEEAIIISVQDPIRLSEHSEPQPDLALLEPRPDYYADEHPGPEDVLLLVEVAESSQEYDRERKIPLYAQAKIPETWLVDLKKEMVVTYHKPGKETYRKTRKYRAGERITFDPQKESVKGIELAVEEILP